MGPIALVNFFEVSSICAAPVSALSTCTTRDLADVNLGTLVSSLRSDGQDMREDLCLDPTNNTSDFVLFRLNRFAQSSERKQTKKFPTQKN